MAFKKGTQVLTMDGWVKIENLEAGDSLWSGGGITKITDIVEKLNTPLLLTGKGGLKLYSTPHVLFDCGEGYSIRAKECKDIELNSIQMGESISPVFTSVKEYKRAKCYEIDSPDGYYVKIGNETGLFIPE